MPRQIRTLQLDPTTVCQAACQSCARETDASFDKSKKHHLTIDTILQSFPEKKIKKLHKMFMCGNYGEPAAAYYALDIFRYFRQINPDIVLGMNTNGGVQSTFWWHSLGTVLSRQEDYCVFSIDGLESTNHAYRRNVSWSKIMSNAEAFIAAGGSAHWDMLVFKHNQHQVDECEELARLMGFKWFRAKVSKRAFTNGLEFPVGWKNPKQVSGRIKCYALENKIAYMDMYGNISPCCWHGMTHSPNAKVKNLIELKASWVTDNPDPICLEACSLNKKQTQFESQWQREIQLR
jgi:sulfatase maturation enzyme AslB (radical SAM superfamily)